VGQVDAMTERAIGVLRDSDAWEAMSAAARRDAERFSADTIVPMYEAYYEEVLAR
jgi:glycosyltransferase involved in cell wall biosynthesis